MDMNNDNTNANANGNNSVKQLKQIESCIHSLGAALLVVVMRMGANNVFIEMLRMLKFAVLLVWISWILLPFIANQIHLVMLPYIR